MSETLSEVIIAAEAECRDASKEHLYPADDREQLPDNTMESDNGRPKPRVDALFQVDAKIDADDDLRDKHDHEDVGELRVDVGRELSTSVRMTEKIAEDSESSTEDLHRDMPSRSDDLKEAEISYSD